eukprot:scaffold3275_cov70-Cyclotella_meneghiniana.AAC.5
MCSISLKSCMTKPKLRRLNLNLQEEKEYMPCDECPTTKTKGVFFAFVQVREHSRILGDHPSVSFGPPITLSWEVESDEIFSVDMYESVRDLYRRSRQQFLVPAAIRAEWLLDAGYTMKEIQEASQAILNNRCRRLVTKVQLREKANEFQENLKKTVDWMVCKKDTVDNSSHNQVSNVQTQEAETKPSTSPVRKQLTRRPSTAFL